MISSLIDELNKSADEWNGSNMFELARMCREAADTIWQLRDDLQRANTENAKLRKYVAWLEKWALDHASFGLSAEVQFELDMARRELGVEVDG